MCCVAEIAALIFGIIALARGRFSLTRSRVVEGAPARIIGVLLLLPLLIGQGGGFIYGAAVGARRGVEAAKQGKQFGPAEVEAMKGEIEKPVIILNVVAGVLPLVIAFGIALATSTPARARSRRRRDEEEEVEDYDDRPRRSRRTRDDEDDEDDDIPRRRRRRREDDEDDERGDEHIKSRE